MTDLVTRLRNLTWVSEDPDDKLFHELMREAADEIERLERAVRANMHDREKGRQVRLIFGDGERLSGMDHVQASPGKVFAVIGPFDHHTDKMDLQNMLEAICRDYNGEPHD